MTWFPSVVEVTEQASHGMRMMLWEGEKEHRLRSELAHAAVPTSAIVAIGPEGGLDPLEVRHFSQKGFTPVSLGNRILRTETASLAVLSILQYTWNEI